MHDLPPLKKTYYAVLGTIFALAYHSKTRRFWGMSGRGWLNLGWLALLAAAWAGRWPAWPWLLALFSGWQLAYWAARRAGYSKFVADKTAVIPPNHPLNTIPPNQHTNLWASGLFAVRNREERVLLRPAEYWQAPLGEHIVMVKMGVEKFLYQFFDAAKLQQIEMGWLIFGRRPFPTAAITFLAPESDNPLPLYAMLQGYEGEQKQNPRTIYLTFDNTDKQTAVWHNIVSDARRVRSG